MARSATAAGNSTARRPGSSLVLYADDQRAIDESCQQAPAHGRKLDRGRGLKLGLLKQLVDKLLARLRFEVQGWKLRGKRHG